MQENKWYRIGFGTLLAVVAAGVVVADAAVTGGTLTLAGASLGLTSAVYAAFRGARTPTDLLARPMAYAALAHSELRADVLHLAHTRHSDERRCPTRVLQPRKKRPPHSGREATRPGSASTDALIFALLSSGLTALNVNAAATAANKFATR